MLSLQLGAGTQLTALAIGAPGTRGPWIALLAAVGGLAVAFVVLSLLGAGVGPQPRLGAPPADSAGDHAETAAAHTDAEDDASESTAGEEGHADGPRHEETGGAPAGS